MKKEVDFNSSYKVEIEFDCIIKDCNAFFEFESEEDDINEKAVCQCGAEYNVYGDISDGSAKVELTKVGSSENTVIAKVSPNQLDMFYNKTYEELKRLGKVT